MLGQQNQQTCRSKQLALTALSLIAFLAMANVSSRVAFSADDDWLEYEKTVQPFLAKHCYSCHGDKEPEADIKLNAFPDSASLTKGMITWEKALRMLRSGKMPPKEKPRPSEDELKPILGWLQSYTTKVDPTAPRISGRVTLRRLNRSEYNNTLRDLLETDLKPADAFPVDDAGYGFDNNGDVLSIAPILMEKYISAAGKVLHTAIFSEPVKPAPNKHWDDVTTWEGSIPASDLKGTSSPGGQFSRAMPNGRVFNYGGEIYADYEFPANGEYNLRLRGYGRQQPAVQFKIDGVNVGRPVQVTEDQPNTRIYSSDKVKVSAGKHRLTLTLVNSATKEEYEAAVQAAAAAEASTTDAKPAADQTGGAPATEKSAEKTPSVNKSESEAVPAASAQSSTPQPPTATNAASAVPATDTATPAASPARPAAGAAGVRPPRNANARPARGAPVKTLTGKPTLGVVFVEAEGPLEVTPDRMSESYRRVMVAYPSLTVSKLQAAERIIRNFAFKAYRRPVEEEEIQQLMELWSKEDSDGESFQSSIETTLIAVLVSPNFLYRYEQDAGPNEADGVHALNEYELANRLSYFIWSSMPDDELFNLARDGQLRANLPAQVDRMIASPKSMALVENFAGQWLQLRQMNNVGPDAKKFPAFDEPLRAAMIQETQLFFSSIVTENRSVLDFIDADYTFMNERLAKHYGRTDIKGDNFRRVALTDKQRGGGLLTQASILTITSYPNRTSPVLRGKWVLENLLDSAPPPPPPDVPKLVESDQIELTGTLRQRMEQHRSNANCISCHSQMDPIGFGLENFDAIGAWRDRDVSNDVIDASGTLPDGQAFQGAGGLKQILMAQKDQFCRCLTNRLLTFALGRGLESYDRPVVNQIAAGLKEKDYKFSALLMQIVESDAFQKRSAKRGE